MPFNPGNSVSIFLGAKPHFRTPNNDFTAVNSSETSSKKVANTKVTATKKKATAAPQKELDPTTKAEDDGDNDNAEEETEGMEVDIKDEEMKESAAPSTPPAKATKGPKTPKSGGRKSRTSSTASRHAELALILRGVVIAMRVTQGLSFKEIEGHTGVKADTAAHMFRAVSKRATGSELMPMLEAVAGSRGTAGTADDVNTGGPSTPSTP